VLVAVILLLPIVYAAGLNFCLNVGIVELGKTVGVPAEQLRAHPKPAKEFPSQPVEDRRYIS